MSEDKSIPRWTEAEADEWWQMQGTQWQCYAAAKEAGADSDVLYAISKPWKYKYDAFASYWAERQALKEAPR